MGAFLVVFGDERGKAPLLGRAEAAGGRVVSRLSTAWNCSCEPFCSGWRGVAAARAATPDPASARAPHHADAAQSPVDHGLQGRISHRQRGLVLSVHLARWVDALRVALHRPVGAYARGDPAGIRPRVSAVRPARSHRSDNGPPFGAPGLGRLSRLAVWWLRLGIVPERITPRHPEQNGSHEQFHAVLKRDTTRPPAASARAQQRRFTAFITEYNEERPHDALGGVPPATLYHASARAYPERLPALEYPAAWDIRRVSPAGSSVGAGASCFSPKCSPAMTSPSNPSTTACGWCALRRCPWRASMNGDGCCCRPCQLRSPAQDLIADEGPALAASINCYPCPPTNVLPMSPTAPAVDSRQ